MQLKQLSPANGAFWPTLKRFLQFGLVGGSGVLVDMAVLFLLADPRMLGWGLTLSKVLAAQTALVNNFLWNEFWTFRDLAADQAHWRGRLHRFVKFNLICLVGIGLSVLLLNGQVRLLQMNLYAANFIAIFLISLWNFWMNLKFGWRKPAPA